MAVEPPPSSTAPPQDVSRLKSAEVAIVWVLWVTYGSFYFCRQNISAAVPGMGQELGYTKDQIGSILAALKIAYAVGQLVNGQLAERFSPRVLLAIGMLGSAALNVVFGFSTGLYFLLFVWAANGYCQALGWTPCLRVATNWISVEHRGRLIGLLGTSYQLSAVLTFIVAGACVDWFGWRGAFYVPAALLAVAAVFMLVYLREAPPGRSTVRNHTVADADTDEPILSGMISSPNPYQAPETRSRAVAPDACSSANVRGTFLDNLAATLTNPALWFLAIGLMLLDACRYGYTDWGLTHLVEVQGSSVGVTAFKYAVLPLGGIAGAIVAGWATDRFFQGRRAPVIAGLLVLLALLTVLYDWMAQASLAGTVVLLGLVGFCIFGPQVLLVGTAPADLARRGTAAAAAGFVNFMGYIGAAAGDKVTGYAVDHYGWQVATYCWAAWALAGAAAAGCLWNARASTA